MRTKTSGVDVLGTPSPVIEECPDTLRIVPIPSADADEMERALVEDLRARHVELMRMRRDLAELVRRRQP